MERTITENAGLASTAKQDYPLNLLDEIAQGEWEHDLPGDFMPSLAYVLATLTEREQNIIAALFKEQWTYRDVGAEYCVTLERIRQIEAKALRKLRHPPRINYLIYGVRGMAERGQLQKMTAELSNAVSAVTNIANAISAAGGTDALARFAERETEKQERIRIGIPLEDTNLSVRAYNVLKRADKYTLGDVADMTFPELMKLRNMGKKSAEEIVTALRRYGLELKQEKRDAGT